MKNDVRKILVFCVASSLFLAACGRPLPFPGLSNDEVYALGVQEMEEARWSEAAEAFEFVLFSPSFSRAAEALAKKLETDSLTAQVKVGEEDRLFGSVTVQNVAELLEEKGYEIERRAIHLRDAIRELGVYNVEVRLHPDVKATVKLWVVKE